MRVIILVLVLASLVYIISGMKCLTCALCHLHETDEDESTTCPPINPDTGTRSVCRSWKFSNGTVFNRSCAAFDDTRFECVPSTQDFNIVFYEAEGFIPIPTTPDTSIDDDTSTSTTEMTTTTTTDMTTTTVTTPTESTLPTTTMRAVRLNYTVPKHGIFVCHCEQNLCTGAAIIVPFSNFRMLLLMIVVLFYL